MCFSDLLLDIIFANLIVRAKLVKYLLLAHTKQLNITLYL